MSMPIYQYEPIAIHTKSVFITQPKVTKVNSVRLFFKVVFLNAKNLILKKNYKIENDEKK